MIKLPLIGEIPVKLVNGSNAREHWGERKRRATAHRKACLVIPAGIPLPVIVTLTRIGPGTMDDDGLVISAKHVRDGIADRLGVDDKDSRVTWRYEQARGGAGHYSCYVRIEERK